VDDFVTTNFGTEPVRHHRHSQDFVWGVHFFPEKVDQKLTTFFTCRFGKTLHFFPEKVDDLFLVLAFKTRSKTIILSSKSS